jgi:hypothetical protein
MAISIAYGIAIATVLTLIILPILLSTTNNVKVRGAWLATGKKVNKEEFERAIKEVKAEEEWGRESEKRRIEEAKNKSKKELSEHEL